MKKKAIIVSIKGSKLTSKEKLLLAKEKPWGLILFKRNIKSLIQTKKLIKNIRLTSKDKKFPIMIDEEGSSVSRLRDVINHNINANYFGNLYKINKKFALNLYKSYLRSLSDELKKLGIGINTIPVLDILRHNRIRVMSQYIVLLTKVEVKLSSLIRDTRKHFISNETHHWHNIHVIVIYLNRVPDKSACRV